MTNPDSKTNQNINVEYLCQVPEQNVEGFTSLLRLLFSSNILPIPNLLAAICIVPESQIPQYFNEIIEKTDKEAIPYRPGKHYPSGVAVPVEKDGHAAAFVLLDERLLRNLTPENYFDRETISTVLEEILHVELYSMASKRRGYIRHAKSRFSCQAYMYDLCSGFHDEYAVNRWKTRIFADNFSAQDEKGNLVPAGITYGESLDMVFNQTAIELRDTVIGAATRQIPTEDASSEFLGQLYEGCA